MDGLYVPKVIVPVQVFGDNAQIFGPDDEPWGYGLCDAVSAWSDCNRAIGHIFRFDDIEDRHCEPGDTLTVLVDPETFDPFIARNFDKT